MATRAATTGEAPLEDLLQTAIDSREDGKVSIGSLLEAFGSRSFGPVIALAALAAMIPPVGAIPGVPTSVGVITALLAVQIVFGRTHPGVPAFFRNRGIDADKLRTAQRKAEGTLARIDAVIGPRLKWAATGPAEWLAALFVLLLGAAMPPLELLPFAAALPASGILLFGLGLTARDGLLMLFGFAASGGTAWLLITNFLI